MIGLPEPHDVRAHLHGGIPVAEIDSLSDYFTNYNGVKDLLFESSRTSPRSDALTSDDTAADGPRRGPATLGYGDFAPNITTKEQILQSQCL